MNVREIEQIIDHIHENHPVFKKEKKQLLYELLSSFEDICSLIVIGSMLNPSMLRQIIDQMDALNMALQWVQTTAFTDSSKAIKTNISENDYKQCVDLLRNYAYPYSVICSGYISFSRNRLTAAVNDKTVVFNMPASQNNSAWSDILRETEESSFDSLLKSINPLRLMRANTKLQENVKIENGMICYQLTSEIIESFKEIATKHWDATKTLPESWEFDLFTLSDYKRFWISLATLCYIHFFSDLKVSDPLVRLNNSTIIQSKENMLNYIVSTSGLTKEKVERIMDYITYNPQKRNVDIMYQPIVDIGDNMLVIAPILFMGSRPERNLLAVISSMKDQKYSKEVNDLEELMVQELETVVSKYNNIQCVKHKNLGGRLPDIDFAVLDKITNSMLLCELKWFAAADSAKEVYAKEDEITHGCQQMESIMAYAMVDKKRFFNQVFGIDNGEDIDIFCCVIARHNIRTQNKYIPVIDLKRIKELLNCNSLNNVFHIIRNHEYEPKMPDEATITHQEISYGGYIFKIPAICFESEIII